MIKIGFCGATHLGLCYSTVSAEKGNKIICYDYDETKINNLKKFKINIDEPKLKKLVKQNKEKIFFTNNILELSKCDFVYFSYDVDTNHLGESDKTSLKKKLSILIKKLNKNIPIIILSQVPPGFTRNYYKIKKNLYYQVETLIFGQAIRRALKPERFIIGSSNSKDNLFFKFKKFLDSFKCPILIMRYESAELSKISINCYLASSVSITNTLVEISSKLNADWNEIVPTLKLDRRIGRYAYLKPGLGISGGNIERDLTTIKEIGNSKNTNINLIKTIINLSKYNKDWLFKKIEYHLKNNKKSKICVLGLAYKENTNSIKNSPSIQLLKKINEHEIKVYDPLVKKIKINNIKEVNGSYDAISNADILVIATPWEEFYRLDLKVIKLKMSGKIIIDPYKVLDQILAIKLGFKYYFIG